MAQPDFLVTELREHQRAGVAWMLHRERHVFCGCRGGLLLDDVGLGKTLQLLTTIYEQKQSGRAVGPTLVISDRQIMDVWKNEIAIHFREGPLALRTFTYHTPRARKQFAAEPDQAKLLTDEIDIVFTTYDVLRVEMDALHTDAVVGVEEAAPLPFCAGSLFLQPFRRILLDEAHKIRNRSASYYRAVNRLPLTYRGQPNIRWGLSAQPILNRLDDLFPLFQFLNVQPYANTELGYSRWQSDVVRAIRYAARSGMLTLHRTLVPIALRRTKDVLQLPPLHRREDTIHFSQLEFAFYQKLYEYVRERGRRLLERMRELRAAGGRADADDHRIQRCQASINSMLLRLRQCCCSPLLVLNSMPRLRADLLEHEATLGSCIERIQQLLEHPTEDECGVCLDDDATHMAVPCRHMLCARCWEQVNRANGRCPFCRAHVENYEPVAPATVERMANEVVLTRVATSHSQKIQFLLAQLQQHVWDEKVVIVSDFRTFLDVIDRALGSDEVLSKVRRARIDGTITGARRFEVVRQFQRDEPDAPRILLMTYRCGGEGLTLSAASRLYEMNPWWNDAQMYQAEGRLHRLGQQRPVHVHRLRVAGSIEDKIYEMVDQKGFLGTATFRPHDAAPQRIPWADRVRLMLGIRMSELAPSFDSRRRELDESGHWRPVQ